MDVHGHSVPTRQRADLPHGQTSARRVETQQAFPNRLYTKDVGTKLSVGNRYLRNPEVREQTVTRSVATSSAIEGIRVPFGAGAKNGASSKIRLKRKRP